nr:prolactin-releasing peptide receptor isoform X2 [Crassostrea gigas]
MALVDQGDRAFLELVFKFIDDKNSTDDVDFTQPHVRRSLRYVYPLFMFLHALVGLFGLCGNLAIIIVIGKRRLYRDQTFLFLGNIAFSDILKCIFVLPVSLANLLIHNWIFGSFMCFFLPMLQCFPIHSSMLTYLMIAIDRYRLIVNPFRPRLPAGLCIIGVWVVSVCIVLPYAVYIKYIDLGAILGYRFLGVGICYINQERHIEEYIRAMFVTLYAMPLAIMGFLCLKVSAELKSLDTSSISIHFETNSNNVTCTSRLTLEDDETSRVGSEDSNQRHTVRSDHMCSDDDLDLPAEKRTHRYIISMVTLFAICWCPLNILILVQFFVHESGNNTGHFDITYTTFTWFGFLSTCVNPVLFASWKMSDSTKDKLRGYFKFGMKRKSKKISVPVSTFRGALTIQNGNTPEPL